jgi:WD40 repeat protein
MDCSNAYCDNDLSHGLHLLTSSYFTRFASWAGKVYSYDIRNVSSPIVSYQDNDMDSTTTNESSFYPIPQLQGEEINQLALYYNHRQNVQYLATADDDGSCRILHPVPLTQPLHCTDQNNTTTYPFHCLIQHASSNSSDAALVTSIAFRPRTKPDQVELVTSGTDCTICSWDVTLKKNVNVKLKSRYSISKLQSDNVNQVCNPPLVHSTCWSPSGRLLSAGLGDGSILILRPEGRRLVEVSRIASTQSRMGHSSAVATVLFPQFGGNIPNSTSHVTTEDRFMVTGGNDGNIIFWDLGSFVGGEYAMDPRLYVDCCDGESSLSSVSHPLDSDMDQLSLVTSSLDPNVLFALNHKKKPNCLLSTHASDAVFANSIIVGDTSNDITIYILPRI